MSKVRLFDLQRIEADSERLGRMPGIAMTFCADANFGILARDLEIADRVNDRSKRNMAYPNTS